MTDTDPRENETMTGPAAGDTPAAGAAPSGGVGPEPERSARGWKWWAGRVALVIAVLALVLVVTGILLFNYGTMWPPNAETEAQYESLVAAGQAMPQQPSPGFRIPIPGCVCHANDPDLSAKDPGHVPDPRLVIAHRYRTVSQCSGCHAGKSEATEGPVQGEPGNSLPLPAQ